MVAAEIKSLAQQTSKATEEITGLVEAIQGATTESVDRIRHIARTIGEMEAAARSIAQTASEQHGAIREISRTVSDASDGVRQVAQHISGVAGDADAARAAAREALVTARSMAEQSDALHRVIGEVLTSAGGVAAWTSRVRRDAGCAARRRLRDSRMQKTGAG